MNKFYLTHIHAHKHIYTLFSSGDKQLGYARDPCVLFDTLTSFFSPTGPVPIPTFCPAITRWTGQTGQPVFRPHGPRLSVLAGWLIEGHKIIILYQILLIFYFFLHANCINYYLLICSYLEYLRSRFLFYFP